MVYMLGAFVNRYSIKFTYNGEKIKIFHTFVANTNTAFFNQFSTIRKVFRKIPNLSAFSEIQANLLSEFNLFSNKIV